MVVLVVLTVGLLIACAVSFPRYLAARDMDHAKVAPTELARARNDVRATLLQGFGGMVLLLGAYLTWRQTQISRTASREELQLTREGQLTDPFTRAVEQLGSDDVAVRVGGIYALGRIADESVTDLGQGTLFLLRHDSCRPGGGARRSPRRRLLEWLVE